jgi:hypothetical protein
MFHVERGIFGRDDGHSSTWNAVGIRANLEQMESSKFHQNLLLQNPSFSTAGLFSVLNRGLAAAIPQLIRRQALAGDQPERQKAAFHSGVQFSTAYSPTWNRPSL